MGSWRTHKFDVLLPKTVKCKRGALTVDRAHKQSRKLGFKSILSCLETQMVVKVASFHPVLLLAMIDHVTNDAALV